MKQRLTYSNVMATIAVFAVLGGTSYAAAKIGSKQIKNNSVTGTDIKNGSVAGKDLKVDLPRWLLLNEAGDIVEQSGGFTVISKPGLNNQPATNPNIYIDAGETLVGSGLSATTAIQNLIDRNGDATPDPSFEGDTSVGRCATEAVINCVPEGTNEPDTLVVRALDDNTSVTSPTRRVYVTITP